MTTLLPAKKKDVLELDELWSFVYSKAHKRWIWVAICRRTRQVVSFFIGDRSADTCRKFWNLIPKKYRRCRSFSDFWEAYSTVISWLDTSVLDTIYVVGTRAQSRLVTRPDLRLATIASSMRPVTGTMSAP